MLVESVNIAKSEFLGS